MGVCGSAMRGAIDKRIRPSTSNFAGSVWPMTREEAEQSIAAGRALAEEAVWITTWSAWAKWALATPLPPARSCPFYSGRTLYETAGPGAGLDSEGVRRKAEILETRSWLASTRFCRWTRCSGSCRWVRDWRRCRFYSGRLASSSSRGAGWLPVLRGRFDREGSCAGCFEYGFLLALIAGTCASRRCWIY